MGTADIFDFVEVDDRIYTGTKSSATIYKSTDQGKTWSEHARIWDRGFLGTFAHLDWQGRSYLLLAGTDQREPTFHHYLLISPDGGQSWHEWIRLQDDDTGGASNVTVVDNRTIIVGTGNHSAQGRAFTLSAEED